MIKDTEVKFTAEEAKKEVQETFPEYYDLIVSEKESEAKKMMMEEFDDEEIADAIIELAKGNV